MNDAAAIEGGYYGLQALAKESTIFVSPNARPILDKINSSLCVDTTQVFATGFSYGAAFSATLACERPDKFRAVALYAGGGGCSNSKPIAFWSTHGIGDSAVPISSGRAVRDHYVKVNGCQAKTASEPSNGQAHIKTVYSCQAGYPVRILVSRRAGLLLKSGLSSLNSLKVPNVTASSSCYPHLLLFNALLIQLRLLLLNVWSAVEVTMLESYFPIVPPEVFTGGIKGAIIFTMQKGL
ncbi:hypothetical protein AeRB84_007551 [Aphanomyces euteiches]|nr:hypothetical protein AeRB84_007551 [Aphanomyces euteiches]